MTKIRFKDLSWPLKTATVLSWIIGTYYIAATIIFFVIFISVMLNP